MKPNSHMKEQEYVFSFILILLCGKQRIFLVITPWSVNCVNATLYFSPDRNTLGKHTSLRYSPTSACLKVIIPVGSSLLPSAVDLAVTPNP